MKPLLIILILTLTACSGTTKIDAKGKHPSGAEGEVHIEREKPEK